jgi:hypothetical protein
MNKLEGNMITTTNLRFAHYERELSEGEQNFGHIMYKDGMSLFYTPIYVDNRSSINNARSSLQTSTVISSSIEGNVLTVNTLNSVYTFSLKQ